MLRYYPSFRIQTNQNTSGGDYTADGQPYKGKFYITYDGKAYSGADPLTGPNQLLTPINQYQNAPALTNKTLPAAVISAMAKVTSGLTNLTVATSQKIMKPTTKIPSSTMTNPIGGPIPYYPNPLQSDYDRGYIIRNFAKRVNDIGYVVEISSDEYANIQNGDVQYDVSMYMIGQIFWKLTGPLNSVRISQYDTRAGIIDTNKRLTETLNKTFLGITDFIGGDYTKWARPTT